MGATAMDLRPAMRADLVTLRLLLVCAPRAMCAALHAEAALAPVPVDIAEAGSADAAMARLLAEEFDAVLLGTGLPAADSERIAGVAVQAARPPFVAGPGEGASSAENDAAISGSENVRSARRLIEGLVHLRIASRVLVVDDSPTMRAVVRKVLHGCSYPLDIQEAPDGKAAVALIAGNATDIVFLDYNMPDMDGISTLLQIKRMRTDVQVVIMTAVADRGLRVRARNAGADGYLQKPFYPADVDAVLGALFGFVRPGLARPKGAGQSPATKKCQVPSGPMPRR